ncbi:hypothetical protein [Geitlerinema sp. PCC 9228]|jgi:hypothetical protein|uniref:hypothetical protein n=1 Tax=Geitlerinema sp. PCC 9228 TaxID=111611 RepID=UPI0008F9C8E6|nr:hypothetical protein [Geitlerinema sp. PCC 9228]
MDRFHSRLRNGQSEPSQESNDRSLWDHLTFANHPLVWDSDRLLLVALQVRSRPPQELELTVMGHNPTAGRWLAAPLEEALAGLLQEPLQELFRRHLLYALLTQHCQLHLPPETLALAESKAVPIPATEGTQQRWLDVGLRSLDWQVAMEKTDTAPNNVWQDLLHAWLPERAEELAGELAAVAGQIEGTLVLEGVDITTRKQLERLTQLLIGSGSLLHPEKFARVARQLRSLFAAQQVFCISLEGSMARLFHQNEGGNMDVRSYAVESLQQSRVFPTSDNRSVVAVGDLSASCHTECDRALRDLGVGSMLVVPLTMESLATGFDTQQFLGWYVIGSDRTHQFPPSSVHLAQKLQSSLTIALRQSIQQRLTCFSNIHPAVEWRFLQEAQRRSLGMPPEPIVFANVYPLYGISDIRGSSKARNRAIQADLLTQFRLALAVMEAVCEERATSLGEQLRLDLLERIEQLQQGVSVESEVTQIQYLREHVEIYFPFFRQCGDRTASAVAAYCQACDNEHRCVYTERGQYDQMVQHINSRLRETWDSWQERMQQIVPHYCDTECTDGIDHMIYAGASLNPQFSIFHLRSLRYEQLRAVCDCARTAFRIQQEYNTHLQVAHLVLVQDVPVDIFHDEKTERLFDVRGTKDTRYEIVKKRIDKGEDERTGDRITQPGMLTLVYATNKEWEEYRQYLHYLTREGWVAAQIDMGNIKPLQGVTGLKFARVPILAP